MSFTRTLRAVGGAVVAGALLFGSAPSALADQIRDDQWPLKSFDAESLWKTSTGKGVTVAVLDSAVNGDHPDLKGNVLAGKDIENGGPANQETTEDHGTAMASIIAGHGHGAGNSEGVKGLAPDAKVLPVALNVEGGNVTTSDTLADAVKYAVDQGATVVNMSFGWDPLTEEEKQAFAYAAKKNVLLVTATGNDGLDHLDELNSYPGVVAVGSVDKSGKVWEKSNYGPQTMLTAPGTLIRSAAASKPYRLANGTSDSAAYVSGAAALLRSKFPDLTAGQIANRLVKTAGLPAGQESLKLPDPHYGYGFIRPYSALTKDIPAGSKNGPLKTPKGDPASETGGATAPGKSGGGDQASEQEESGLGVGAIVGIAAGVLVVVAIIVIVVVRQKKNGRNGPPNGGPGGYGGAGGPGFPQQPGAYQQQPGAPSFPPAPPTQPPGQ